MKNELGDAPVPKDKHYPADAGQCDHCGGNGCTRCDDRGWVAADNLNARRCPCCKKPIHPEAIALYCSVHCAMADTLILLEDYPTNDESILALRKNICPDCGTEGLVPGPCGGMSMNVSCGECGASFNAHGANACNTRDVRYTFSVDRI